LEIEDHVVLDVDLEFEGPIGSLIILSGSHGMIKRVNKIGRRHSVSWLGDEYIVEFGALNIKLGGHQAYEHLTLFRRSQHSKRRV